MRPVDEEEWAIGAILTSWVEWGTGSSDYLLSQRPPYRPICTNLKRHIKVKLLVGSLRGKLGWIGMVEMWNTRVVERCFYVLLLRLWFSVVLTMS